MSESKKSKKNEVQELKTLLQHTQADFENYRKRVDRDKEEFTKYACEEIIKDLLTIIDNFELALKNTSNPDEFAKGVELIYGQLYDLLHQRGLHKIEALDKEFDPTLHEALIQEESDKKPGTIIEVFQKGYTFQDRVLRHSKVKVSKEREKNQQKKSD